MFRHSGWLAAVCVGGALLSAPAVVAGDKDKPAPPKKETPKVVPGLDGLPLNLEDLFKGLPLDGGGLDPKQVEELQKQLMKMLEELRKGGGLPGGGLPGLPGGGGGGLPGFPGGGGLPGFPGFPGGGMRLPGIEPKTPGRLGAVIETPSETLIDQLGLPEGQGVVLAQVNPDSPAAKAGLKANDILLGYDGKAVPSDPARFKRLIDETKAGAAVDVEILRKGKKETIKGLTLPAAPKAVPAPRLDVLAPGAGQAAIAVARVERE